jgi:hypothetical protein
MIVPVQAVDRSRVLTIALFASGMGLKFGSVFVEKSAQDSYNQYLSSAIQTDIATHRDDYTSKHDLSVGMSRVGTGLVGLAALISIFDGLNFISKSSSSQLSALHFKPGYDPQTHETALLFQRRF